MTEQMVVMCLDLEGVLIPEIWVNLAEKTGIEELKLTTRDIKDYDELMQLRLGVLDKHGLKIQDFQEVVATMNPLDGAMDFLNWLKPQCEVIILSDTFREFALPLIHKLGNPTIFCHSLQIGDTGRIENYVLRQPDQKRKAVLALRGLNFRIVAAGDSYNDLSMLQTADSSIFFRPNEKITQEYPDIPVTHTYQELMEHLSQHEGFHL